MNQLHFNAYLGISIFLSNSLSAAPIPKAMPPATGVNPPTKPIQSSSGYAFTVKNLCPTTVWLALYGPSGNATTTAENTYKMAPSSTLHFTMRHGWVGNVAGRLYCDEDIRVTKDKVCEVANCGYDAKGNCNPDLTPQAPLSQIEFTDNKQNDGSYRLGIDLSNILGIGVPLSITPDAPVDFNRPNFLECGNPGSEKTNSSKLANCTWQFTPPSDAYKVKDPTGKNRFLGYKTTVDLCDPKDINSYCAQKLSSPPYTVGSLYKGFGLNSCYNIPLANQKVCNGWVDWKDEGITAPTDIKPQFEKNVDWTKYVLPQIVWLKRGCPTGYVFPSDDRTVAFGCTQPSYTITFCPGGHDGSGK